MPAFVSTRKTALPIWIATAAAVFLFVTPARAEDEKPKKSSTPAHQEHHPAPVPARNATPPPSRPQSTAPKTVTNAPANNRVENSRPSTVSPGPRSMPTTVRPGGGTVGGRPE